MTKHAYFIHLCLHKHYINYVQIYNNILTCLACLLAGWGHVRHVRVCEFEFLERER